MHFRRLKRPINEAIRTTVRSIESYRDRCLEVQTSSIDGSLMTLTVFIDGAQCFRKPVGSANEATTLARGTRIGMRLIDAMDAACSPVIAGLPPPFRVESDTPLELPLGLDAARPPGDGAFRPAPGGSTTVQSTARNGGRAV